MATRKHGAKVNKSENTAPVLPKLTERQERFVVAYVDADSETRGNKSKSAVAAGYSERSAPSLAWTLMKNSNVLARIDEFKRNAVSVRAQQTAITLALLRAEHLRLARVCESKEDYTNATRNWENLGRTIGAYTDSMVVDVGKVKEFADAERREAKRIAALLLTDGKVHPAGALPGPQDSQGAMPDAPGSTIDSEAQLQPCCTPVTGEDSQHASSQQGASQPATRIECTGGGWRSSPQQAGNKPATPGPGDGGEAQDAEALTPQGGGACGVITPSPMYPVLETELVLSQAPPMVKDT